MMHKLEGFSGKAETRDLYVKYLKENKQSGLIKTEVTNKNYTVRYTTVM